MVLPGSSTKSSGRASVLSIRSRRNTLKPLRNSHHDVSVHTRPQYSICKGRITRLLKEIENDGLIERRPHPIDRRSQTLHLTAAGDALMNDVQSAEQDVRTRMTRGLTPKQIRDFDEIANLMADNLDPCGS